MSKTASGEKFIFRALDKIGYPAAEEDAEFLKKCFIDSGHLQVLSNCQRPERILLGRTGSGKTALLNRLYDTQENVIRFDPENLSLNYVLNSTIISFLQNIGVNFDVFFSLLWKHVFAVELIRLRYNIQDKQSQSNVISQLFNRFRPAQRNALEYLQKYGDEFWIESDHRVITITKHFETELQGTIGFPELLEAAKLNSAIRAGEEQRKEICARAQKIVDQTQCAF